MRKDHIRTGSNSRTNFDTFYPSSPSAKSSILGQTHNFYFKKREQPQLIESKSLKALLPRQAKLQAMLQEADLKNQTYKQTIKLLEETINDLDKLNGELINQSKQYSNRLQQFTYKANQELQEKNGVIQSLKMELKKYQSQNSFSQKRIQILSSKEIRDHARTSESLNKKQHQYKILLKNFQELSKEKEQQVAYYDKVIQQKEETIIKMTEFNNQLCMKLLDKKKQFIEIKTEDICSDHTDFDFVKNFNLMKEKLFQLFQEKELLIRKIDVQNERIAELQEMYAKSVETIQILTQPNKLSQPQYKAIMNITTNSKAKSQTSSSRSQDQADKSQAIEKRDKISSVYSLTNLLKNQFTFSQHIRTKSNQVFEQDTNKSQENLSQSKETLVKDLLSDDWSYDSIN